MKRINCIVASEQVKECDAHHFSYTGRMPCTGSLRCIYCGLVKGNHDWQANGFCLTCHKHCTDPRQSDVCQVTVRLDNDIAAIDTDSEDQQAELLQEMAEEEHRCLEADEAMSGMKDA